MENAIHQDNIVRRMAKRLGGGMEKWMPDAFIWALVLTIIVFFMGIFIANQTPFDMIRFWAEGFSGFLLFSMQMVLVMVTGNCLGTSPIFKKVLRKIGRLPKSWWGPYVFTVIVCAMVGYINWGLSFVIGALLSKRMALDNPSADYPALVAAAFAGAYAGIFGLSNSAPLMVNTPGHALYDQMGLVPLTDTVVMPATTITILALVMGMAFVFRLMAPRPEEAKTLQVLGVYEAFVADDEDPEPVVDRSQWGFAQWMNNTPILIIPLFVAGIIYIVWFFATRGFDLNLNIFIFVFFMLGIIAQKTPENYINAMKNSVKSVSSLVLNFPFYGGLQGMMRDSGLVTIIANWFVRISTPITFTFISFVSAAIISLAVPSAGGQWLIHGPILVEAGVQMGSPLYQIVNSYSYGDILANYIQPFWALPILSMAGLKVKDIWGYTMIAGIVYFTIATITLFTQAALYLA